MKTDRNKEKKVTNSLGRLASGVGIGIVAGLVGTAVMTAAQIIEMQISGREPSDIPYKAVKKTFGVKAQSEEDKELVSHMTHITYGSIWGIPRGLMAAFGTNSFAGTTLHFGAVWGTELIMLPAMDVAKPVTTWKPKAISEDALFHGIYALATGFTADALAEWLGKSYRKK